MDGASDAGHAMPAMSLGLVYYILFRHKWKILVLGAAGLVAALIAWRLIPIPYASQARVLIRYVEERQSPTATEEGSRVRAVEERGSIIRTEAQILTSFDLALEVARQLGPEQVLDESVGSPAEDLASAAGAVFSGLTVDPQGAVLQLEFRHADAAKTQPILAAVIESYLKRHVQVHRSTGGIDAALIQETDQRRSRLLETEEELRKTLEQAGVIDLPSARTDLGARIARLQEELFAAEAALAENRAQIQAMTGAQPPSSTAPESDETPVGTSTAELPTDVVNVYRQILVSLPNLYTREQQLLAQFTAETTMVKGVRSQIAEQEALRARLEKEYPQLLVVPEARAVAPPATQAQAGGAFDVAAANARVSAIEARRRVLNDQLSRLRADLAKLGSIEARITELQRARELQEQQFRYLSANLERARVDEAFGPNRVSNISVLQSPSPPMRQSKKALQIIAGLAVGGLALGIGVAVAIELFLDQSLRRASEIESSLNLPFMLSIPRLKQIARPSARPVLKLSAAQPRGTSGLATEEGGVSGPSNGTGALVPWSVDSELRQYFDALRNRIVYSFEMRNITRKPKLVAVTSAGAGAGTSTVASGLAASLSETGDGNVLLVDMNPDRKSAHFFHRGDLKVGLSDALENEKRDDAMVRENLYMVSQETAEDRLNWLMPKRFATLVPKLKASDYDYIIFDLPPVSQISATPQLARFMDQVLLVVESEQTSRDAARRAGSMLTEAGANVAVVLNKTHDYVPRSLTHEL